MTVTVDNLTPQPMIKTFNMWNILEDTYKLVRGETTLKQIRLSYKPHHEECSVVVTHVRKNK